MTPELGVAWETGRLATVSQGEMKPINAQRRDFFELRSSESYLEGSPHLILGISEIQI